jgi:Carboxypeptidase regulatory-like domain/TonB dependent receptor
LGSHEKTTSIGLGLLRRHEMTSGILSRSLGKFNIPTRLLACELFLFFAGILVANVTADAQVTGRGTISGVVTDSSGAVVAGARMKITNIEMNVSQDSVTNGTGYFEVNGLNPGTYRIAVTSPGFESLVRAGITLAADAHVSVPLKLSAGEVAQTILVNADATLLNTESGSSGQVLSTRELESLPVSGTNPTWLALIAPGVQGKVGQAASTDDTLAWTGLTQDFGTFGVIGVNEFSLDGAPNMTNGRQSGLNPTIDEVSETKFDVTGYEAAVGHTMGVSVTQTTKSGTNDLHGSVRETYTAKRWAAMNHFQGLNYRYQQSLAHCIHGASTSPECYAIENTYGWPGTHMNNGSAAVGGPVYIPRVFDGRNKLFFFVSVLDDVFSGAGSQTATVPTMQERTGDFSDLPVLTSGVPAAFTAACPAGTPYFGQYQIYDPFSVVLDSQGIPRRTPFCGNVIPAKRMANNQMVKIYNSLMPVPTQNNPTGTNFTFTQATPQTYRDYTARVDYKFSSKDNLFVRYTRGNYNKSQNDYTVGDVGQQEGPRWIDVPGIGWDHVFSEHTNLDVALGGTNFKTRCCYYPGYDKYSPSSLGLPSYTDQYAQAAGASLVQLPVLQIANYENSNPGEPATSLGQTDNVASTFRTFALRGNVTHVQGNHTIRAGAEYRWQNSSSGISGNVSGTYTFDNSYTQQNNGRDSTFSQSNTGLSYAAFLMGINTSASVARNSSASLQSPYYALYAGDTWRVTPRLTIIPGLRFEFEYGVVEKHNQLIVGWDPNASLPIAAAANTAYQAARASATAAQQAVLPASLTIQGGPMYAGVNGAPRSEWQNSYRFLPRIAVAYQLNPSTVVRVGYGLFFDTLNALSPAIDQDGFSTGTSVPTSTTFGTNFVPGVSPLSDPFPAGANGARFNQPIGSAAGSMYYLGGSPSIYDHGLVPAREQRGTIGIQHQFGSSTMVDISWNIARTTHITMGQGYTYTPGSFYKGGQQPNTAPNALLGSQITNPFALANFSGLASSNPAAYNLMSHNSFFTQSLMSIGGLARAYPQMGGLNLNRDIGESNFQELLITVSHRYSHGLTLMASFQVNDQHDRDYFANGFDPSPSWEPSNNSEPTRFTLEWIYDLPFGRGRTWAASGWKSAVFGGFQFSGTYEAQPGPLIGFGNNFYIGSTNGIKLNKPTYHNNQASGGSNYVQWLDPGNVVATPLRRPMEQQHAPTPGRALLGIHSACQPHITFAFSPPASMEYVRWG